MSIEWLGNLPKSIQLVSSWVLHNVRTKIWTQVVFGQSSCSDPVYFIFMTLFANMSLLKLDGYNPNSPVSCEFLEVRWHHSHICNNQDLEQNIMNCLLITLKEKKT